MQLTVEPFTVHKRVALTISRSTSAQSTNFWLRLHQDGIEGWGEATAFSIGDRSQSEAAIAADFATLTTALADRHPTEGQAIEQLFREANIGSAARAAVDLARHDWLGKSLNLPLWQLWGLDRQQIGPTSVTIGIMSPAQAQDRLALWQQQGPVKSVKLKLGSTAGMDADQAMVRAVTQVLSPQVKVSVDANGGWDLKTAVLMADWLGSQGVTYIEQPLAPGQEGDLPVLYEKSPLPIFVDESCWSSADVPTLADRVHGVNLKLMKTGGLAEAQRLIHTARACGLQVMFGCYSDSAIANTALAHLSPLADHLDLDSHLNLKDDPFQGATWENGHLLPPNRPGLGVIRHASHP